MRLLLPNGGGGGLPACAAPSRYARRSPKNKVGLCLIKVRPCFLGKPPCFSKVPVCFAALALGLRPCPAVCSARVCLLRAPSPAGCGCAIARTAQSEGVADGQMIGQRVLEARHVVPSALTRVVRRVKGNAHVETDDQKVEVVAQAYAGAYGNVFQVFQ